MITADDWDPEPLHVERQRRVDGQKDGQMEWSTHFW
jgi:hypothetical protein